MLTRIVLELPEHFVAVAQVEVQGLILVCLQRGMSASVGHGLFFELHEDSTSQTPASILLLHKKCSDIEPAGIVNRISAPYDRAVGCSQDNTKIVVGLGAGVAEAVVPKSTAGLNEIFVPWIVGRLDAELAVSHTRSVPEARGVAKQQLPAGNRAPTRCTMFRKSIAAREHTGRTV